MMSCAAHHVGVWRGAADDWYAHWHDLLPIGTDRLVLVTEGAAEYELKQADAGVDDEEDEERHDDVRKGVRYR